MTTPQENTISMWNTTNSVLATNNSIWSGLAGVAANVTRFRSKLSASSLYIATQQSTTKGVTTDKKTAKTAAITEAVIISGAVQAYAQSVTDNELYADMNFPKSKLDGLPDTTLVTVLQLIHTTANGVVTSLTTFGVTATVLTAYQTLIGNYNSFVAAPRTKLIAKKTATADLKQIIKDGNKELTSLDKLIPQYKTAHPDFVSDYTSGRQTIDLGATQTRVKGKVTDEATGLPIPNAQVYDETGTLRATTNAQGNYSSRIHIGSHSFRCVAPGYQDKTINNINIKPGQSNVVDFLMIH